MSNPIISEGWNRIQEGKYQSALQGFSSVLNQPSPEDWAAQQEALRGLTWCWYHLGCADEDSEALDRALHYAKRLYSYPKVENPDIRLEAHRILGWCHQKNGAPEKAIEHFDQALALLHSDQDPGDIRSEISAGRELAATMVRLNNRQPFINSQESLKLLSNVPLTELGLPEYIEIEPVFNCNLRCIQCHVSYEEPANTHLDLKFLKHMKGLENKWVILGSNYEPTAHPQFPEIIEGLGRLNMKIDLISNGTLFTPRMINQIAHADFRNIFISFDGIRKQTYEKIRRNADFETTLDRIQAFKQAVSGPDTYFSINNTLMRSTLDELNETVAFWERAGFDHLGLFVMMLRDDNPDLQAEFLADNMDLVYERVEEAARLIIENDYRITMSSAALNPMSPLRHEHHDLFTGGCVRSRNPKARTPVNLRNYFQSGPYPGMPVDCRSPFKFARILYNGDVQLCFQFIVGNIHEKPFLDIWFGKKAQRVRQFIREREDVCRSCDYFNLCIKAGELDLEKEDSLYSDLVVHQQKYLTNTEQYKRFTLIPWLGTWYGVPMYLRSIDASHLLARDYWAKFGLVWGSSAEEVKSKIDRQPRRLEIFAFRAIRKLIKLTTGKVWR